jgi:hypothetical protein
LAFAGLLWGFAMLSRFLWLFVALSLLGCGPGRHPTPAPVVYKTVPPRELYNAYVDSSGRWDDWPVRVVLPPGSFVRDGNTLLWHTFRTTDAPSIVFAFATVPTVEPTASVTLTGVCRGKRRDEGPRGSGFKWHVLVDGCQLR